MELWMSSTANAVRHDLYGMNASEEEFQAVYQVRKVFEERWGQQDLGVVDDVLRTQYAQEKAARDAQIRERLGEQRYAEYERGSDEAYHQLSATVSRFSLPKQAAAQVYELKRTLQSYNDLVRNDAGLSQEQKDKALTLMAEETEKEVKLLLGEKAFRYYLTRGLGNWLGK